MGWGGGDVHFWGALVVGFPGASESFPWGLRVGGSGFFGLGSLRRAALAEGAAASASFGVIVLSLVCELVGGGGVSCGWGCHLFREVSLCYDA